MTVTGLGERLRRLDDRVAGPPDAAPAAPDPHRPLWRRLLDVDGLWLRAAVAVHVSLYFGIYALVSGPPRGYWVPLLVVGVLGTPVFWYAAVRAWRRGRDA